MEANAARRNIVRRDTGEGYRGMLERLAQESGIETPTAEDLARLDRKRKGKKLSNQDWVSRSDPEAKIAKMKDGTTHLAYKPEHAVDLDTGAVVAAELHPADEGDTTTLPKTLAAAEANLEAVDVAPTAEDPAECVTDKGYHSRLVQTITDNLRVNRSGTIHKDEDFVVSYYTSLIGPDYTVATLLSDSKTDKVCIVDYGFPTFVYESLFQTIQYEETIHAAKKHCTVDRRFFETLSTNSNGYKYTGVLDNRDGQLFHPDYITFHVYYFHIYEPDMTPAVVSYEIYGEFVNPDDASYYEVCKMVTGYKSLLTVANVREFQWGVDWLRIFDDPHWKPKE